MGTLRRRRSLGDESVAPIKRQYAARKEKKQEELGDKSQGHDEAKGTSVY